MRSAGVNPSELNRQASSLVGARRRPFTNIQLPLTKSGEARLQTIRGLASAVKSAALTSSYADKNWL
jgi:hypothetical protein